MRNYLVFLLTIWFSPIIGQENILNSASTWHDIINNKKGAVVFYWYDSNPFIYKDGDELAGIEYEISSSFVEFVEEYYEVQISPNWIRADGFSDIILKVKDLHQGVFGMSAISITKERAAKFNFTPVYIPDINVLVSHPDIPIAHTSSEFNEYFDGHTAFTIAGTTFDQKLIALRNELPIEFEIKYIPGNGDIIKTITDSNDGFGYIDLPTYIVALHNETAAKRQLLYPLVLEGLGLIYSLQSDWNEPVDAYFNSSKFQSDQKRILSKYLGIDVTDLIDRISNKDQFGSREEVIILTKEKELQHKELLEKAINAKESEKLRNLLIAGVIIVLLLAILFYNRAQLKTSANKTLTTKQKQIEHRNQQLIELNEEKNGIISWVAHDLRSPINQIAGLAQIFLIKNKDLDEKQKEIMQLIINSSNHLSAMINKILDVDAIESSQFNLNIETIDLGNILKNVVSTYQEQANAKNITLETSYLNSPSLIQGDHIYLTQAIENIISNAIKFSGHGKKVTLIIEDSEELLTLSIADQGPGFTDVDKKRVFKKFARLSAKPTGGEKSTGLGLSIVKNLIELMDGTISFESDVGKGTIFYLRFKKTIQL